MPLCDSTSDNAREDGGGFWPVKRRRGPFGHGFLALFFLLPALVSCDAGNSLGTSGSQHAPVSEKRVREPINLVVLPEGEEWMVALAAPVIERLTLDQHGVRPLLLVTPRAPKPEKLSTLNRIPWRRALALHRGPRPLIPGMAEERHVAWLRAPFDPAAASLALASRFWKEIDALYIASLHDPAAAVQAATLAAHEARPIFLHAGDVRGIDRGLARLRPAKAFTIRSLAAPDPDWRPKLAYETIPLTTGETVARIQEGLRKEKRPGTILLARIPDPEHDSGPLAWLAPHWSAVRRAPVVLVSTADPIKAEAAVYRHVEHYRIAPRTLTLLATSYSIDLEEFSIPTGEAAQDSAYSFMIEPCSFPKKAGAVLLGVGRIPALTLGEASLLFAGGLLRESASPGRAVVISNAGFEDDASLPLAETVSRATAAEMRNARIDVHEFNRIASDDPRILRSVETAQVILYQGHSVDNRLFPDPAELPALPLSDEFAVVPEPGDLEAPQAPRAPPIMPTLEGRPIVFLQSCSSLQEGAADRFFAAGTPALIGSVTSIHSASGSTFAKALIDGAMYRGATVGEALRDARNYYLTLIELKNRRGHTQQAKALRVAMSFRLWGDPELSLFPGMRGTPVKPILTAHWTDKGHLKVVVPERRLPAVRTEAYRAHFLPGSEAAGLVKRVPDSDVRALLPLYFFRVPVPADFEGKNYTRLRRAGGKPDRAAFFYDRLGRFLYVVYLPSKEKPGETFTLRFE